MNGQRPWGNLPFSSATAFREQRTDHGEAITETAYTEYLTLPGHIAFQVRYPIVADVVSLLSGRRSDALKRAELDHFCTYTLKGPGCVTRKVRLVLRLTLLLLPLTVLLLISGIKSNLCCWGFFDFLNAKVLSISREKSPNLLSAGREPNATCSNQDLS